MVSAAAAAAEKAAEKASAANLSESVAVCDPPVLFVEMHTWASMPCLTRFDPLEEKWHFRSGAARPQ